VNRIRTFATPHKGLRNILAKFSLLAGHSNFNCKEELDALKSLGREMFLLLDDHVVIENEFVLKPLEQKSPGSSEHDLHDHEQIEQDQALLKSELKNLSLNDKAQAHQFYLNFTKFQYQYLEHIYHEEEVTERLLWEYFTDNELLDIRTKIINHIDKDLLLVWWKYIIPAQNEDENKALLIGLRNNAPDLFKKVQHVIREEMSSNRFNKLMSQCS